MPATALERLVLAPPRHLGRGAQVWRGERGTGYRNGGTRGEDEHDSVYVDATPPYHEAGATGYVCGGAGQNEELWCRPDGFTLVALYERLSNNSMVLFSKFSGYGQSQFQCNRMGSFNKLVCTAFHSTLKEDGTADHSTEFVCDEGAPLGRHRLIVHYNPLAATRVEGLRIHIDGVEQVVALGVASGSVVGNFGPLVDDPGRFMTQGRHAFDFVLRGIERFGGLWGWQGQLSAAEVAAVDAEFATDIGWVP